MRRLVLSTACLLIALVQAADGQGQGQNTRTTPVPQQQQQPKPKLKPARVHPSSKPQQHQQAQQSVVARAPVNNTNVRVNYAAALQRFQHQRHNRVWWKQHFAVIVLVGGGYYYWDAGYWFPAWGYDPVYEYYDYDGPIYTYGNLLPDEVILNVQRALQEEGYYGGALTGALTSPTRQAIAAYQRDAGLFVNGIVDGPTVQALGLE